MRPEWLKCETCLFFIPQIGVVSPYCRRSPRQQGTTADNFCGSWTCARCLWPWRQINFEYQSPERQFGWEFYTIPNHFSCQEVT